LWQPPSALPDLFSHPIPHQHMLSARRRATSMAETTINMIDALQGQLAQLKRLLAQKMWISEAPKATLSEMEAQVIEVNVCSLSLRKIFKTSFRELSNARCRHRFSVDLTDLWPWPDIPRFQKQSVFDLSGSPLQCCRRARHQGCCPNSERMGSREEFFEVPISLSAALRSRRG